MKKLVSTLLAISCLALAASAQLDQTPQHPSRHGTIEFNGVAYPCTVTDYDATPDVVSNAVIEYMKSRGYKADNRKGFLIYRSVQLPQVNNGSPVDLLILVDNRSKKEKEKATVYTITAEPGKIPDKKPEKGTVDAATVATAGAGALLLADLQGYVSKGEHSRLVGLQEAALLRAERKLKDLQSDYASMQKKLERLQKDMEQNKKDQQAASKAADEERKKLEELRKNAPRATAPPATNNG
jgi:outer membrane murein-binding lipoprotein Lpp